MHRCAFIHLHVHSEFSLLSGVPRIKELAARAKAQGARSLALTDRNRMSGLILFHNECRAQGVKPILGVELDEPGRAGTSFGAARGAVAGAAAHPALRNLPVTQGPRHACLGETVVLLAKNAEGYGDLCELISARQMGAAGPGGPGGAAGFTFAHAFAKPRPNLFFLTAFPRALRAIAAGPNRANLFGELIRNSAESRERAKEVAALCDAEGIPVVAAGDVHFLDKADFELHRILRAIDLNSTLSRLKAGETAPEGAWMRSGAEMAEIFVDRADAIENAGRIAEACEPALKSESGREKWIMPEIRVPNGYTPDTYLAEQARRGLERNYAGKPSYDEARKIQEMELGIIAKLGYSSYFLMVKEVRDWASGHFGSDYRRARDCSILRGSGANSITFYNLGVCNLDPIKLRLYFQRFLNEDRAAPPDADLDFGWDERDAALRWMVERFGREHVAITCTTNHFRFNAAFREVAKVFGFSDDQSTQVLNSFETHAGKILDPAVRRILEWAKRITGRPRFLGQHPGGLIITNQPIWRHVACEWSREGGEAGGGRLVTQVDMHNGIDDLGLIKFDLLGNGSLSVLRDALRQLEEQGEPDPEVWDVEKCFEDPAVKRMLTSGGSRGIFYIESPAQIRLNQKAYAESFDEIVITSSLIRPAGTAYCKTFVERHRKMKKQLAPDWKFVHPALEEILEETHDVCAFQEDVIRICHEIADLPYKQADRIRKMMNSQHEGALGTEEWEKTRRAFIHGCLGNARLSPRLDEKQASELWRRVSSFTGFSFCKSHSASYAELSFQCAHLKTKYPAQFLAAVISNRHGFYTRDVYLDEARRCGLRVLPLDVNESRLAYHGKDDWIRPGLVPVRDCREAVLRVLVEERARNGRYRSLIDLLERVPLHKREAENLILAGAMEDFGMTQPELLYLLDAAHPKIRPAQPSLFSAARATLDAEGPAVDAGLDAPGLADYSLMRKCLNELHMLGYVLSANLLHVVRDHPDARGAVRSDELARHVGHRVRVIGIPVTDRLHPVARDGRHMKFLTLGDSTGYMDVIFWPDALERWNDTLVGQVPFGGNLIEIRGRVTEDWDTYSVEAENVRIIEWMPNQLNFELLASRRLREQMRYYPAYAQDVAIAA